MVANRHRGDGETAEENLAETRLGAAAPEPAGSGRSSGGGDIARRGSRARGEREVVRSDDRTEPVLTWFNQAKGVFGSFHDSNLN